MSTDTQLWTLSRLRAAQQTTEGRIDTSAEDPITFRVPKFQRSLVWPDSKRDALVSSILRGLPFGAILLVQYPNKKKITLLDGTEVDATEYGIIDGLQRTNAIASHLQSSLVSADAKTALSPAFDDFVLAIRAAYESDVSEDQVLLCVERWMRKTRRPEQAAGFTAYSLLKEIATDLEETVEGAGDLGAVMHSGAVLLDHIREAVDISNAKIPVLIYSGPSEHLPDIFEQINRAGTMLSKYEIFAAAWVGTEVTQVSPQVESAIQRRYAKLERAGFTVDTLEDDKSFTLFEYLHGLSQVLGEQHPLLFSEQDASAGELSGAFPLATLMLGQGLDRMGGLDQWFGKTSAGLIDVGPFEKALFESVEVVEAALAPFLSFQFTSGPERLGHGDMQMVSMVAAVAAHLYDHREAFAPRVDAAARKVLRSQFQKTLPQHYIYDLIRNFWRGSLYSYALDRVWADSQQQHSAVGSRNQPSELYLRPVDRTSFESAMATSLAEQLANVTHSRKNIRASDRTLLKFIYARRVTVAEQKIHQFDVEHWIPVRRIQRMTRDRDPWPMGALGNLGVLPAGSNRVKKEQTLLEYLSRPEGGPSEVEAELIQRLSIVDPSLVHIEQLDGKDAMTLEAFETFVSAAWQAMTVDLAEAIQLEPTGPAHPA
jgi:hypothetical protein